MNKLRLSLALALIVLYSINYVLSTKEEIVSAARSQIGVPYSWGGGDWRGKSIGIKEGDEDGSHTVGFDCSGLAMYSVYQGTGKIIERNSSDQYLDHKCYHVNYTEHDLGDLVFFDDGGRIHHVAVLSSRGDTMIHAPHTGDHVREAQVPAKGRVPLVQRCV